MDLHIVLHGEEHEGADEGHHGLAVSGGLGHNMYYRCVITMTEQALPCLLGGPGARAMVAAYSSH